MKINLNLNSVFSWHSILLMQLIMDIAILCDIPITRQVVSFIFITVMVGAIPAKLLKIESKHSASNFLLFSTAFSIFLIMFIGFLTNEFLSFLGNLHPLSTWHLLLSLNCFTFGVYFISRLKKDKRKDYFQENKSQKIPPWILTVIALPLLSIVGCFTINQGGNNFLILLSIITVCIFIFAFTFKWKNKHLTNFSSLLLFTISISLFLQSSLVTDYIVGHDIYEEFYVFSITNNNMFWNSSFSSELTSIARVNDMLSVTILPTVYCRLLNVDGNLVFKFLYPYILSWLVIGLYEFYSILFNKKESFLSVFFYTTNNVVLWLFSCRQIVAELFYIVLFILFIDNNLRPSVKKICYLIFGLALVVSHYSMAYIFMFLVSCVYIYDLLLKKTERKIQLSQILIIFVFSFTWYMYTCSAAAFKDLLNTLNFIYRNFLNDFFRTEARETMVISALGGGEIYSFWNIFGRLLFYLSEFFIVIGVGMLVINKIKGRVLNSLFKKLAIINFVILLMCIVLPHFSKALQASRFYQITLLFLAPLCIIGGKTVLSLLNKKKQKVYAILLLSFQIPFFLFQSGFVYAITGNKNWSIPLSYHKGDMDNPQLYYKIVYEEEVLAARWLRNQITSTENNRNLVYADLLMCDHVLTAYGLFAPEERRVLTNVTQPDVRSYIYLGRLNVIKESFGGYKSAMSWNASDLVSSFRERMMNKIYSNGASEIYYSNGLP